MLRDTRVSDCTEATPSSGSSVTHSTKHCPEFESCVVRFMTATMMLEAAEEEFQKTSGLCIANKHYRQDFYSAHGSPLGLRQART